MKRDNPKKIKLVGERFGRLEVVSECEKRGGKVAFLCKCDCGNYKEILSSSLRRGHSTSCGCYIREISSKHGMYKSRINKEYREMKQRALNPNHKRHEYYYDKGVRLCDEWNGEDGFMNFYNWSMANGYSDDLSIDRIDPDGNYEPDNCRWADDKMQARNRRIRYTNKTGISGVHKRGNKYRVEFCVEGKAKYNGSYDTIEKARDRRKELELQYWGFTNIKD